MELQFYFGGSGSGKSTKLYQDIIDWSVREPKTQFLMIVPDQFTMQTQMDMVCAHPRKGIMNIDVLSFSRLSHRILEEVGGVNTQVLDDTGKSLVLRKVAAGLMDQMPIIGGNLYKQGYIHEVKSAISEFMQYGLSVADVSKMSEYAKSRGALQYKLKDLQVIYQGFQEYIKGNFITTEETLDVLKRSLEKSELISKSVIVFDGFTGFTPIQNRVIQELIRLSKRVIFSITLDASEDPFQPAQEQSLFYLSKKTVSDLCKLAQEIGAKRVSDVVLQENPLPRFRNNPEMAHLEKHLFRYPMVGYEEANHSLHLIEASTVEEEVRQTCIRIKKLVLEDGYAYRDIAVVSGDMATYGEYMDREAVNYEIPLFLDQTRGILLNPFIEYIRGALQVVLHNFSYETVFHFLRSGLTEFTVDEIDHLENYVLALGIRGKKKWGTLFTRRLANGRELTEEEKEEQLSQLEQLNRTRATFYDKMRPLMEKLSTAGEMVTALYDFVMQDQIEQKLKQYENSFLEAGEQEKAKEYAQIYRLTMQLLEQVYALLQSEPMELQEFAQILDAGFGEIEVGTIPRNIDRVVVGDIERTRLKQIKVLFFLGINDGNIPKNAGKGGIISDIDREFLRESEFELSPSPRQQMYIQRLYLYLNMTKPSDQLYLSFAKINREGKSMRPAYLVDIIQKLFPELVTEKPELAPFLEQVIGKADTMDLFTRNLRRFADGQSSTEEEKQLFSLCQIYKEDMQYDKKTELLIETAFMEYQAKPLSKLIARAIYGSMLQNSVSRLEKYAACAYAHFLQYGLNLQERDEYGFEAVDLGNVFHGVLELFGKRLEAEHDTWMDFSNEQAASYLRDALTSYTTQYGETVLYSNARNEYAIERIYRILYRTVDTIRSQLQKGTFVPEHYEMSFAKVEDAAAVNIALTEEEKMKLRGRIDRIDTCEDSDHIYVKVVDYKSGSKKFDMAALYYGLQLQLVVYMNVALEWEQKKHPDKQVVPAALLYYHVSDPMIREDGQELTAEQINEQIRQELRTTGLVNESSVVVDLLDKGFSDKSQVVPVERKKDGSYSAKSSTISAEDYQTISNYVNHKISQLGTEIIDGKIDANPCDQGGTSACTYCSYRKICGFDPRIPGYEIRELPELSEQEALARMREISEQ